MCFSLIQSTYFIIIFLATSLAPKKVETNKPKSFLLDMADCGPSKKSKMAEHKSQSAHSSAASQVVKGIRECIEKIETARLLNNKSIESLKKIQEDKKVTDSEIIQMSQNLEELETIKKQELETSNSYQAELVAMALELEDLEKQLKDEKDIQTDLALKKDHKRKKKEEAMEQRQKMLNMNPEERKRRSMEEAEKLIQEQVSYAQLLESMQETEKVKEREKLAKLSQEELSRQKSPSPASTIFSDNSNSSSSSNDHFGEPKRVMETIEEEPELDIAPSTNASCSNEPASTAQIAAIVPTLPKLTRIVKPSSSPLPPPPLRLIFKQDSPA